LINNEKYCVISCHVMWRELCYYASLSNKSVNFIFLEQGLHCTPDILREKLQNEIDKVDGEYEYILLGYGLCSRGTENITVSKSKLVLIKGHDCITFFLGSKERYKKYFDSNKGTYWYTPSWIETGTQPSEERYNSCYKEYLERYGEENAEYLMEMEQGWFKEYNNAAYVDLGFMDAKEYKDYTRKCAEWLKWDYDELEGDSQLIKDFFAGNWDNDRFLIVNPGQKIIATNDNDIITAK
jgi:hypothetical protein